MRAVSPDPAEDAEIERKFFESNRTAYADLRDRGLLPPEGENFGSQDIDEYLLKGGAPTAGSGPDAAASAAGVDGVVLGGGWDDLLREELDLPYWSTLLEFVTQEHEDHEVYPPWPQTFKAFELTPYDDVKAVILGQDPYINPGQAHGLAFSVPAGVAIPPSLRNIRKELAADLDISLSDLPDHGDLTAWAEQGVLLLNTTLTVRRGRSNSHEGMGWETFTDAVISAISAELEGVVFILWGGPAQKKAKLIDLARHPAPIKAAHPKARANARNPLAGSKPFTTANNLLIAAGRAPVDWSLLDWTQQDR
jgi:uracil-DNA glycosylase